MEIGTSYYVDAESKEAKDTNDGLSWDKPFKTFSAALAASTETGEGKRNSINVKRHYPIKGKITIEEAENERVFKSYVEEKRQG